MLGPDDKDWFDFLTQLAEEQPIIESFDEEECCPLKDNLLKAEPIAKKKEAPKSNLEVLYEKFYALEQKIQRQHEALERIDSQIKKLLENTIPLYVAREDKNPEIQTRNELTEKSELRRSTRTKKNVARYQ